ncbi:SDR family NAD(P)-dependent oxidoreductase [Caenibius tardaugens]|uniref:SDR family NAD(P)-dependent oxidoreductase n=1 Tax=Caenibius tardaugens TaxID=169176 RepID=UPI001375AF62|nr:SDR family oxidoreductase [Caenibius tardaugens]
MTGFQINGHVGVVTGGCSGIGRAIAETLIGEGAQVVVFDLSPDDAPTGTALALNVDVSDEQAVARAFATIEDRFGDLDFAVNNAGIDIETEPSEEWLAGPLDRTIDVDLKGVYHCMRHAIALMRPRKSGAIVNIGSVAALVGTATRPVYAASKHAVTGLTRTAAIQFGEDNIRTNIVCPGGTRTDLLEKVMTDNPVLRDHIVASCPMRRLAEPSEIADAVLWLVSPRSSFVNGAVISVDGGIRQADRPAVRHLSATPLRAAGSSKWHQCSRPS